MGVFPPPGASFSGSPWKNWYTRRAAGWVMLGASSSSFKSAWPMAAWAAGARGRYDAAFRRLCVERGARTEAELPFLRGQPLRDLPRNEG